MIKIIRNTNDLPFLSTQNTRGGCQQQLAPTSFNLHKPPMHIKPPVS